jgi:hypothetical protein
MVYFPDVSDCAGYSNPVYGYNTVPMSFGLTGDGPAGRRQGQGSIPTLRTHYVLQLTRKLHVSHVHTSFEGGFCLRCAIPLKWVIQSRTRTGFILWNGVYSLQSRQRVVYKGGVGVS